MKKLILLITALTFLSCSTDEDCTRTALVYNKVTERQETIKVPYDCASGDIMVPIQYTLIRFLD